MKKFFQIGMSLLFASITNLAHAQESIGFSDSTDIEYVIDYLLPEWGYSQFSLSSGNIDFMGVRDKSEEIRIDERTIQQQQSGLGGGIGFTPRYEKYFESEERVLDIITQVGFSTSFGNDSRTIENIQNNMLDLFETDSKRDRYVYQYYLDMSWKEYLSGDVFLSGVMGGQVDYGFDTYQTKQTDENLNRRRIKSRRLQLVPGLGIGFGRIRNVNPVLRALRLNERYKTLTDNSLSGTEIIRSAEQFSQYTGYQRSYDRPLKYFWDDMNKQTSNRFATLPTFDQFYLNDVFNENLGSRYEGFELSLFVAYSYENSLTRDSRDYTQNIDRYFSILRFAYIDINAKYYKNLTLNHQLYANFYTAYDLPLERIVGIDWRIRSNLDFEWLWILADRWQITNSWNSLYTRSQPKERLVSGFKAYELRSELRSDLNYYIENRMVITGSFSLNNGYSYSNNGSAINRINKESRLSWAFTAGIQYFFNRNLF